MTNKKNDLFVIDVIHLDSTEVGTDYYVLAVYRFKSNFYYQFIPLEIVSLDDFVLREYLKGKLDLSNMIKGPEDLKKFQNHKLILAKIRENNLNKLI